MALIKPAADAMIGEYGEQVGFYFGADF